VLEPLHFADQLGGQLVVGLGGEQLAESTRVGETAGEAFRGRYPRLEGLDLLNQRAGALRIIPESRLTLLDFELLEPRLLGAQVKGSLAAREPGAPTVPSVRPASP